MAKRKSLKSKINEVCSELVAEVVATSSYVTTPNQENMIALISSILKTRADYIRRVSHVEPGMDPAEYFRRIGESFNKEVEEISDAINNLQQ